jgi:hypothetical protein
MAPPATRFEAGERYEYLRTSRRYLHRDSRSEPNLRANLVSWDVQQNDG